jgi:hypothetical protein
MLYYIGKELSYIPDKQFKNIEIMVDPDGNVIAYDKMVNGQRKGLDSEESDFIIEHAKELRDIIESRAGKN